MLCPTPVQSLVLFQNACGEQKKNVQTQKSTLILRDIKYMPRAWKLLASRRTGINNVSTNQPKRSPRKSTEGVRLTKCVQSLQRTKGFGYLLSTLIYAWGPPFLGWNTTVFTRTLPLVLPFFRARNIRATPTCQNCATNVTS